jgi:histidyl-tRNA synthetase
MTEDKGLDPGVADQIGEFVKLKGRLLSTATALVPMTSPQGGPELLAELEKTKLASNISATAGINDMRVLFRYLDVFGITSKVRFPGPSSLDVHLSLQSDVI